MIPGFFRKAAEIAKAGIYDLRVHHDDVVMPLLRQWKVFDIEGLDAEGEQARTELAAALEDLDGKASRFVAKREEAAQRAR
jgi:acyl-[acyl-carrier-protein] desaturase